jgi:macrodomain Ter protein organizer (MatP/YcbG family)
LKNDFNSEIPSIHKKFVEIQWKIQQKKNKSGKKRKKTLNSTFNTSTQKNKKAPKPRDNSPANVIEVGSRIKADVLSGRGVGLSTDL